MRPWQKLFLGMMIAGLTGLVYTPVARAAEYIIIDLSGGPSATHYPVTYRSAPPAGGWTGAYKTTKLVIRRIQAGTFTMGSPENELGREIDEPQSTVTLTENYYIGVYPVTQKQWERVMGNWPSFFNNPAYRDARPVEQVSYFDIRENPANSAISPTWPESSQVHAQSFMGRLRAKTGLSTLDLPTEAQWERAGRAGTTTALNSGKNLTDVVACPNMSEVGRYYANGGSAYTQEGSTAVGTATVGSYVPNAWGLYDIHGDVFEWNLNWYEAYTATMTDPVGAASGTYPYRMARGGSWHSDANRCRSAYRSGAWPNSRYYLRGFRLSRTMPTDLVMHTLTVVNGTGGGAYEAGTAVAVTASAAPDGYIFSQWSIDPGGANLGGAFNAQNASTIVTMPAHAVTLTAQWGGTTASPVYRFWSSSYNGHFFTISAAERDHVISTWPDIWQYERVAWRAHANPASGTSPVYRFWSPVYSRHFFTISAAERDHIMATWPDIWHYEGVAWHAYTAGGSGRYPIFRFWSPVYQGHFFTISAEERDHILATWPDIWSYEGVAYYAYTPAAGPAPASMVHHEAEEPLAAEKTDTTELAEPQLNVRQAEAVKEPSDSDSEARVVASAPDVLVELESDGVYFPLNYTDTVVTAAVYDPDSARWRRVLAATWEPAGVSIAGGVTNRQWLIVLTYDAAAEGWAVAHGSWFGRLPQFAPDKPDGALADDYPIESELPVEVIFLPEDAGELRLRVYDLAADADIETIQGLQPGARYEWAVPQWNRWYRVDVVRERDGTVQQSQWVGHHVTHTYDSVHD